MIGAIFGDVVGSIYEFDNIKTTEFQLFSRDCTFTDDTVMTVAVAEALMQYSRSGGVERFKNLLIAAMHRYGDRYPDAGYGGRFYGWVTDPTQTLPYNSYGNGSAMRVSAVGWYADSLEEALTLAEASAAVTHNHPEGIAGAVATAGAVYLARNGASREAIREFVSQYYTLDFTLDEIRPTYTFTERCADTVPQAMQAFFESEDFEDAIRLAVSIGGDSDTLAAITGAVAEAYYGMEKRQQFRALSYLDPALCDVATMFANGFCQPR